MKRWSGPFAGQSTRRRLPGLVIALALMISCAAMVIATWAPGGTHIAHAQAALSGGLEVSGGHLANSSAPNTPLQLRGVDRSGTEYACIQGWGIFDGPSDAASVAAIAGWGANFVRVPLNEDCWLNINGVASQYGGSAYQNAVVNYVNLLHANGIYAEVSLMWEAPGTQQATFSNQAPDEDHAPAFWTSVAQTFEGDHETFFGLMNEPHGVTFGCWLNGGSACGGQVSYSVAGAQQLVTTIRATGATNVIAQQCIDWSNTCNGWLSNHANDPAGQLIAEAHVYGGNGCASASCFDSQYAPILAARFPMVWGETGEVYDASECGTSNISQFLPWADAHGVGYAAWTWDTWGTCLALINSYSGTPANAYGTYVQQHLLALSGGGGTPTATATSSATSSPSPSPTATNSPSPTITASPSPTPTATATPPAPSGALSLVQSVSSPITARVSSVTQAFAQPVGSDHLLVALVGTAGGNAYRVSGVSDSLGDHWTRATTLGDSDGAVADVWYTQTSAMLGPLGAADTVTASFSGSGWMETVLTVAEYNGPGTYAGSAAQVSHGTSHASGVIGGAATGDLIVALYTDGGYGTAVGLASGSDLAPLGTNDTPTPNIQTDQASGSSGTSAAFTSAAGTEAIVAAAAFVPTGGGPTPTPTPSPSPSPSPTPTTPPSPSPSPSPSPAPPSFGDAPAMTVQEAFSGGVGSDVVLQLVVTDPSGHVVASVSQAEASMPSGAVIVSMTFAAIAANGAAEPGGTQLTVEARVVAASGGAVLFDDKRAQMVTVP